MSFKEKYGVRPLIVITYRFRCFYGCSGFRGGQCSHSQNDVRFRYYTEHYILGGDNLFVDPGHADSGQRFYWRTVTDIKKFFSLRLLNLP